MTGPAQPPPPPWTRARKLLWPTIGFVLLMSVPPVVALALISAGVLLRVARRAVLEVRARDAEIARRAALGEMITIGRDERGAAVRIPERALRTHGLILGATGAGKSTTLLALMKDQLSRGRAVVAIDLKGSPAFADSLRTAAEHAGRRFTLWSPDGSVHWNPLASGNATELKDKLLGTERFTEPHYRRAAERYLQLAIQAGQELAGAEPLTLSQLVALLSPERLAIATRSVTPQRRDHLREYISSLTPDQHSAVRGLASRLAILTESHIGPLLEPSSGRPTVDLHRALRDGEVVLFSLNSSSYGSLAAMLGTLAVQDLVSVSGERLSRGQGSRPALVAVDEFSALHADNVLSLLARGREAGIGVLLATQELADLDRLGRGFRDQVLGNTALKIAHRQDVPDSAETVAKLAGTMRVWEESYQHRPGTGRASGGVARGARLVDRYHVDPERVRTLGVGEAVVVTKTPHAGTHVARIAPAQLDGRAPAERDTTR